MSKFFLGFTENELEAGDIKQDELRMARMEALERETLYICNKCASECDYNARFGFHSCADCGSVEDFTIVYL